MKVETSGNIKSASGKVGNFFLIFGLIWFVVGLPFGLAGYFMLQNENLYEKSAIKTIGTVDSKFVSESRSSGKNSSTTRSYNVRYTFKNDQGLNVSAEDSISNEAWQELQEKGPLNIEFIPGRSDEKNRIIDPGRKGGIAAYLFMAFGLLMEGIGLAFLIPYFKKRARYKYLAREGTLIEADVTSVGPGNLTINGVRQWQVQYSYKDTRGQIHTGTSESMAPHQAQPWNKGDKCKVKFDKNKPSVNMFIGN